MGVADRVRKNQAERRRSAQRAGDSLQDSPEQYSLVPVDPPHIKRLRGVVSVLTKFVQENDAGSFKHMTFLMTHMTEELADELSDYDEMHIRAFMFQIGEIIGWIGHGDNSRLPDTLKPFANLIQPDQPEPAADDDETGLIEIPADVVT